MPRALDLRAWQADNPSMTWIILAVGIFAGIGLAIAWSESSEWRSLRKRTKHMSRRKARRAKAHYLDQKAEEALMDRSSREAASLKGVRSLTGYGLAAGGGLGTGSGGAGCASDGAAGDCD